MQLNSRRHFVKNVSSAIASIILFNPIKNLFAATTNKKELPSWNELVDYARWCPTVHNLQPHQIKIISETDAELYYNPLRLLPVGDPKSIFATVAMGIFIEHLSIAAAASGYMVELVESYSPITTTAKESTLFGKLKIKPAIQNEEIDRSLISKRRTSRLHYNGNPLDATVLDKMQTEAGKFNHELFSTSQKEMVSFLINLNQQILFEDLESSSDREELYHLFRYTKEEAANKKDGLWAKCMGFSGSLMKSVFLHHDQWEQGLKKIILSKYYKHSFKGTATVCWFAGKFDNSKDWLTAGRMLARNWLLITKAGAYIHPFGSLITNVAAYKKIKETLSQPKDDKKIWMIFRAGYSDEPTRSYRLNTNQIIIPT